MSGPSGIVSVISVRVTESVGSVKLVTGSVDQSSASTLQPERNASPVSVTSSPSFQRSSSGIESSFGNT